MSSKFEDQLVELDRRIEAAQTAGDREAEAAARSQKALVLALSMDLQAAAEEVARVGALAEEEGQVETVARAHLAQGKALLNQPGRRDAARDALQKAAALYHTLEDAGGEAEALEELANLALATGDLKSAVAQVDRALDVLQGGETSDLARAIGLYQMRSSCHVLLGDLDAAAHDLGVAIDMAERTGDEDLALQVRLQQHTLHSLAAGGPLPGKLAALLQEAQRVGNLQATADIRLQQAARSLWAGEYHQALEQAEAARVAARDATDLARHVRYLSASLMMVEAQEQLGDRPGVLAALLTCKVYLETHLGQEVGRHVDALLDALEQRWGREGLAEAVRAYQQRVRDQGPYQV